jgi:phosphocarrier protein
MIFAVIFYDKTRFEGWYIVVNKVVTVTNKIGFHARPASQLIHTAQKYQSSITLIKDKQQTNLGSLISLMKLRVKCGDVITLKADGPDEESALNDLVSLIESRFGEE